MVHAKALRVVGQALEAAGVTVFELEKHGRNYVVWSDSLKDACNWISRFGLTRDVLEAGARSAKAHCSLCFGSTDISRLDAQARRQRRDRFSSSAQTSRALSQGLRTLGDQLDRIEASAFHLSWTLASASMVILPVSELIVERRTICAEELQRLCLQRRLRRAVPGMRRS